MKNKSSATLVRFFFLLGVMSLLLAGIAASQTQEGEALKASEETMATAGKTGSPTIPPIDAALPATFETASFGLG